MSDFTCDNLTVNNTINDVSNGFASIDANNRQLTNANGTGIALDWSVTDRLCIGAAAFSIDDGITAVQIQSNGNMNLFPAAWGAGQVVQSMRFGDIHHALHNIYGGGFFISTYPGANDPIQFGQNFIEDFSLPKASAVKIIPSGASIPIMQTIIGNNVINEAGDGVTALQVIGGIKVTGLPTSSSGLSSGSLWNDSGNLKIV